MSAESIRLYAYALSPYSAKVHCFLAFKALPFEIFYVDPLKARKQLPVGYQVPVLQIGDEARGESSEIAWWLDERFPETRRLLPDDDLEVQRLMDFDGWISARLIPAVFRIMLAHGEPTAARLRNRRRGAKVLDGTVEGGLPAALKLIYPLVISRPGFIRRLINTTDGTISNRQLMQELYDELEAHLEGGPFFGGRDAPGLADLSAYPQLVLPLVAGYDNADGFLDHPTIETWARAVAQELRHGPPLLPAAVSERSWP
jgi:glutathione S-transferase